ncbi:DUF551 domain-containing protein [Agrobacterium pusense]|uniref:DUF551 domain-containing protein n=1 Tax=Agrobacterium pusense TaxID=648995 RepID=UPI00244833F8|nr:DUF551 domain-containing protein [Agrobacterium pusense]MDH0869706.1 DUF551 domain-containing protein [Agrobacterium pusense]
MVTDEMLKRAIEAYAKETGAEDWQLDGWINSAIRAALEAALSAAEPVEKDENPMRFFADKVDNWGALEWFNRMADACEDHDRKRRIISQCTDDEEKEILEISANTSKMVMTSSAFHLARECKDSVISALSAQVQDVAGWQDISTLEPKDGMIVMGWGEYRERDGFSPAFMRWYDSVGGWNVNAMPFYPTHWMPLPAAPAKQDG